MTQSDFPCRGCGVLIHKNWRGPDPKWCSERCRKEQYAGRCIDCGARTSGSDGHGPNAPKRCVACAVPIIAAERARRQREEAEPERQRLVARFNDGVTLSALADEFGCSLEAIKGRIFHLRSQGYDLPYRRSQVTIDAIREGTRKGLAA
jgi:hypothetical protein